jgi:hypothetical protein
MRLATRVTAGIECALLLIVWTGFPAAAQQSSRPDIVLNFIARRPGSRS